MMKHSELVERVADAIENSGYENVDVLEMHSVMAKAALAVVLKAQGWQPIETAPKDGTNLMSG